MGTEAFWVPLALATASGGAQYENANAATSRANNAEAQTIADQTQFRNNANSAVKQLTSKIASNSPQQLQDQATSAFVGNLRRNAAGSTQGGNTAPDSTTFGASESALAPGVVGSSRYKQGNAASQQQVEQYGNTNASEMAATDAAVRQRQGEGLAMQTLGTGLNTIGVESQTKSFVDQLRAQAAGQQNPWVGLFSSMAGNLANYGSKNWGAPAAAGNASSYYGDLSPNGGLDTLNDPTTNYWQNLASYPS